MWHNTEKSRHKIVTTKIFMFFKADFYDNIYAFDLSSKEFPYSYNFKGNYDNKRFRLDSSILF